MKKKLFSLCVAVIMILSLGENVLANVSDEVQIIQTDTGTMYQSASKSVEYMEDEGGYYFNNVTADEVLEMFDNTFEKEAVSESVSSKSIQPSSDFVHKSEHVLAEKGIDTSAVKAGYYIKSYKLKVYVNPPFKNKPEILVYYVADMKMTTVTYSGKEYAMFVDFSLKSDASLESNEYRFANGTTKPVYTISNSGATLSVKQMIQLETTQNINGTGALSAGWIAITSGTGYPIYYRTETKSYSNTYNLPLINIVK